MQFDLVLEAGGHRPLSELRRLVRPGGHLVLIGGEGGDPVLGTTSKWIHAIALSSFVREKLRPLATKPNQKDLLIIRQLAEAGTLRTQIDRRFPLASTADAFRYMKTGTGQGKIVIQVA
jgi:NADPH:quinone reductase-like Zn-dependent oxidoreductase